MTECLPAASRVSPAPAHRSPVRLDAATAIAAGRRSHQNPPSPLLKTSWEWRPRRDAASTACDGGSHAGQIPAEDIIGRGPVSDANAAIAAGRRCHKNPRSPSPEILWERRPRRDAASTACDGGSHAERIAAEDVIGCGPVSDANAAIAAGRRSHKNPRSRSPETPWERRPRRDAAAHHVPATDRCGVAGLTHTPAPSAAGARDD